MGRPAIKPSPQQSFMARAILGLAGLGPQTDSRDDESLRDRSNLVLGFTVLLTSRTWTLEAATGHSICRPSAVSSLLSSSSSPDPTDPEAEAGPFSDDPVLRPMLPHAPFWVRKRFFPRSTRRAVLTPDQHDTGHTASKLDHRAFGWILSTRRRSAVQQREP